MTKPERQFWLLIKDHLPGDVSRVENIADVGTPDVTGAYNSVDYWIELKTSTNKYKILEPEYLLRPAQRVWHIRRRKHGSKILIITKYPTIIAVHHYSDKEYCPYILYTKTNNKWPWTIFERNIETLIQRRNI